jgi:hypothetical protein
MQNRILATYATNPKRAERLMKRVQRAPRDARPAVMATLFGLPFAVEGLEAAWEEYSPEWAQDLVSQTKGAVGGLATQK